MSIEIAAWTHADLPEALDALLKEAVDTGHDWSADFLPAWHDRPFTGDGEALLLAWEGGRLLAMAALSADPCVADGAPGRLRFIYVLASARRRGIADRLVQQCLARAKGRWRRLRLHTDNPAAARLYERHGFRPATGEGRSTHVVDVATP